MDMDDILKNYEKANNNNIFADIDIICLSLCTMATQ